MSCPQFVPFPTKFSQDGYGSHIVQISSDNALFDIAFQLKNSYHQIAVQLGGAIGGRYPIIVALCGRIKAERERVKNGILNAEQVHRAELENAKAAAAEVIQAAKEAKDAENAAKEAVRKELKKAKSKVRFIPNHSCCS